MNNSRKIWNIGTGARLSGMVPVHGNKNAALPAITAALLLPLGGALTLGQVPRISDVSVLLDILGHLGI
ncbi:MAG: UDP-N-acetylglucosamine 1-carboxyvinyltransferase, partial [Patescibacteria group bacterium]